MTIYSSNLRASRRIESQFAFQSSSKIWIWISPRNSSLLIIISSALKIVRHI